MDFCSGRPGRRTKESDHVPFSVFPLEIAQRFKRWDFDDKKNESRQGTKERF